jgi:SAM-dependent methyltransferase
MPSNMETIAVVKCELCKNDAELRQDKYPGYQEPHTFQIYHCAHCNTAFSLPRSVDTQQVYDLIYQKGAVVPGYDRYWKYAQQVKTIDSPLDYLAESEDTYWSVREALLCLGASKEPEFKILEIGSGLGYLTYSMRKAGYNALGLDISEAAVNLAKANYGDFYVAADLFDYSEKNTNSYDVVVFTEVIEHVDQPLLFVQAVLKMLKINGKAIITTPNKSLYPADILWESDLPPVHCWWFSEESMEYIADKLGARLSFIDFSKFYREFRYVDYDEVRRQQLPQSFFDAAGNVQPGEKKKAKSKIRSFLANNAILKRIFYLLRTKTSGGIVRLKKRGLTLCAVFERNN